MLRPRSRQVSEAPGGAALQPARRLSHRRRIGQAGKIPLRIALCFFAVALPACTAEQSPATHVQSEISTLRAAPRDAVEAQRFMVAAANPLAAEAGRAMLRAGGSAVDAAIAVQMVLNVVEPQSSGIGGGGFLLHYAASSGEIAAYDGREVAPAAAKPDRFLGADGQPIAFVAAARSGLSVGVPGVLRMLDRVHRDHGRLPWARLFEPAIEIAEKGFAVSPRLHASLKADSTLRSMSAGLYFYEPDGQPKAVGTILRNPALAATFRAIARDGAEAFYRGPIAADIVRAVGDAPRASGGMTLPDIAGYEAKKRPALCAPYRAWRICGMPPPSSGGAAVLQILGILEGFELSRLSPESAESVHLVAEASRLAFADRNAFLADPDFVAIPLERLLDPTYLGMRARLISRDRDMGTARPGLASDRADQANDATHSTTHLSVVDAAGNVVAFTSSIEHMFGSGLMVRGFLLNNQLTDFSFEPSRGGRPIANRVEGGKRPRSSMSPIIVFDQARRPILAIGSAGGAYIIATVTKTLLENLDWKRDIQSAIEAPSFANRNGATELESGTALEALRLPLEVMGHTVLLTPIPSGLHGIAIVGRRLFGGVDPRREGVALGE